MVRIIFGLDNMFIFFILGCINLSETKKSFYLCNSKYHIMFDFDQYLGFLAFLTILTIGFWLMIFLVSIIPYWIGGALIENMKLKREAKKNANK
jgi:hypothetical protein